jgi:hypothetical protein
MLGEELSATGMSLIKISAEWKLKEKSHAMLVDQKTEGTIVPLNTAMTSDGKLELANSAPPSYNVRSFADWNF